MYFRFPTEDYEDLYWDDDYEEGRSFSTWLRSKYTGPYVYGGEGDYYLPNQYEVRHFCEHFSNMNVNELSLQQIQEKIDLGGNPNNLLERLCLRDVLYVNSSEDIGKHAEDMSNICGTEAKPVAHELVYEYDYGDGWEVRITVLNITYTDEDKEFVC